MNLTISITFITPCFCRGADCSDNGVPEIRPASIRGQLHWWFRAVGGTPQDENAVFGGVHGGAKASPLVVRVRYRDVKTLLSPTLPHKSGGHAASKQAIAPDFSFELCISTRLNELSHDLENKFLRAFNAWLHLGALGLRATRGGGNFTWQVQQTTVGTKTGILPPPKIPTDYVAAIKEITAGTMLRAALLNTDYQKAEDARKDITNTLNDKAFGETAPLGRAIGGQRKTSPLRFRVIKFDNGIFRIAAVWDGRQNVTGNTNKHLNAAIHKLEENGKNIGIQLAASSLCS